MSTNPEPQPSNSGPSTTGGRRTGVEMAGLAAGPDVEASAKLRRNIAMMALWGPMGFLLLAMYLRFHDFVDRIISGFFGYLFPAVIIALLAALTWWALHRASRGNILGDRLVAARALDAETEQIDNQHHNEAMALSANREDALEAGRAHVIDAESKVRDLVDSVELGRKIAADLLRVRELPPVPAGNIRMPEWQQRTRVAAGLEREQLRGIDLDPRARTSSLLPVEPHRTPWHEFQNPAPKVPDIRAAGPQSAPTFPPSTLNVPDAGTEKRRRTFTPLLIALAAVLVIAAAAAWFLLAGTSFAASTQPTEPHAPVAAPTTSSSIAASAAVPVPDPVGATPAAEGLQQAHPAQPADLVEGRDFSFFTKSSAGDPARWSCDNPITVHIAGPSPAVVEANVADAISAVAIASGLPLSMGQATPKPITLASDVPAGQITISFLTSQQAAESNLDLQGDVLGKGGPKYTGTGAITSGWVAIRTDGPADITDYTGEAVLMHELSHAVGVDHSASDPPTPEIMAPKTGPQTGTPLWGDGDAYALAAVGCTRG